MELVRIDGSRVLPTRTPNLAMVRSQPGPGPGVTVQNHCYQYPCGGVLKEVELTAEGYRRE